MKFKLALAAVAFGFLLTGCSDKYTAISDKNTAILTIGDQQVTKAQLYSFLLSNDGANQTLEAVMGHITGLEIEVTAELEAEAKEQLANLKETIGDEFPAFLKSYGYTNEDEYYDAVVLYNLKNSKLIAKYVETKFDTLALTQKPRKVQIIEVTNKDKAKEAFDKLEANVSFEVVGKEFGTVFYNGSEQILLANSGLDAVVAAIVQNTTTPSRIKEIMEGSNGNYYLVNVVQGDPEQFKEEAIEALSAVTSVSDEATRHFLKEVKFRIHDKLIYDQFKSSAPDLIFD